jgi:hypothetical protein
MQHGGPNSKRDEPEQRSSNLRTKSAAGSETSFGFETMSFAVSPTLPGFSVEVADRDRRRHRDI